LPPPCPARNRVSAVLPAAPPGILSFSCTLCGGESFEYLLTGYDRAHASSEDYTYYRCAICGLVRLLPPPPEARLAEFYPESYASHSCPETWEPSGPLQRTAVRWFYGSESLKRSGAVRAAARRLSERMMRDLCEPRGECRLLDVGCGSGGLLQKHRRLGWSVFGIEPSAGACEKCRALGLEVHQGSVFDAPIEGRQFDVILLHHVVEHLPDPVGVMRRLAGLLAPEGRVIVRTPNARALGLLLFGSCWKALEAPRHLFLFTPHTLGLLARRAGLVLLRATTRPEASMLSESRQCRRVQGKVLPPGLEARKAVLGRAGNREDPSRVFRRLISPAALVFSLLRRGETLVAEMASGK
jgi:SAM-dependent methyltransferase